VKAIGCFGLYILRYRRESSRGSSAALIEHVSPMLVTGGLLPPFLSWAAQDISLDQARVVPARVESMMHAIAVRFDKVQAYTRLQHYSASDDRFGLKAEMVARIHYDHSTRKTFEIVSRGGSPLMQMQ
jgi:hypothetical protein